MKFFLLTVTLLMLNTAMARSMWTPRFDPPPFDIHVSILRAYGNGCPSGITAAITPDKSTVSILFDQLVSELPASPVLVSNRKTCSISLGIRFPGQNRVAIVGSDARGFVALPAGATASIAVSHQSIYSNARHMARMSFSQNLTGPVEQNVEMLSRFNDMPLWSQCGSQMRYNRNILPFMTITIDINTTNSNPGSNLIAAMDSLDFSAPLSYHLVWTPDTRNCPR